MRTTTVRSADVSRTYRTPARMADAKLSAPRVAPRDLGHRLDRTTNTPATKTALLRNTGPGPHATMITPAMAGPTTRAMLVAKVPNVTLAGTSSGDTTSGTIASQAGKSIALPAPMARVITRSTHGWTTPTIVSTPSNAVITNSHT